VKGAFVSVALLLSLRADAYVRTRSSFSSPGVPSYWPGGCVFVQPDSGGTPDLPSDQVFSIVQKSMQNWQNAASSCSYLQLRYDAPAPLEAHYDGVNVVKFRTDRWCHPDDAQDSNVCYSEHAAAITSVFMINDGETKDGLILDADVELNDINFTFVVVTAGVTPPAPRPNTMIADLENTLTHELGHLQGLSHTCKDSAWFKNDVDQNGNPPTDCTKLGQLPPDQSAIIENATMYNFATPGETKKRAPTADDVAGICNAYPTDPTANGMLDRPDQNSCMHTSLSRYTSRSGCDYSPRAMPAGLPLILLLCALGAQRLRRRV
jgi:hypothetical protein